MIRKKFGLWRNHGTPEWAMSFCHFPYYQQLNAWHWSMGDAIESRNIKGENLARESDHSAMWLFHTLVIPDEFFPYSQNGWRFQMIPTRHIFRQPIEMPIGYWQPARTVHRADRNQFPWLFNDCLPTKTLVLFSCHLFDFVFSLWQIVYSSR